MLREPPKIRINKKTIVGFNESHEKHSNKKHLSHPESPNRIHAIKKTLKESGILETCEILDNFLEVDFEDLRLTHGKEMINEVVSTESFQQEDITELCEKYDSVFMTKDSVKSAKEAVACVRELTNQIMNDNAANGFAIVRPPGHHADPDTPSGFCIFNNAAQAAEEAFLQGADRILIVDLDVHHGQGTQRKFYDDKRVLYFSIHRYEHGNYWPHLPESDFDHIGEGTGKGYNANLPLNETGCGDADYITILFNVLIPLANQFDPHFVIVSAGFDSCIGDPLGGMNLTPDGYSHIIYHLKSLAQGKLLLVLEGGYNHEVSAVASHRCLRVLLGHSPVAINLSEDPKKSTITSCIYLITSLQPYWSTFDYYTSSMKKGSNAQSIESPSVSFTHVPGKESESTGNINQAELRRCDWAETRQIASNLRKKPESLIFFNINDARHFHTKDCDHPETPNRTKRIMDKLSESDLFQYCSKQQSERKATSEEIRLVHTKELLEMLKKTANMTDEELEAESDELDSIYLTKHTLDVAKQAVGTLLQCVDEVFENGKSDRNGFVVIRPPGHHASSSTSSGFCIFNNVAIATKYAQKNFGVKKVLILDWDVHHGNGTQEIFYEDSSVLYISLHRHECGAFYPMGEPKDFSDTGEMAGEGFTVNIPFSGPTMGDFEYQTAFNRIVMPIAYQFNPDLVFISAGFDAARNDPLGAYDVSPETFAFMTYQLCGLASGKVIGVLEGGYNLNSISNSALAVCEVLVHRSMVRRLTEEKEQFASKQRKLKSTSIKSIRDVCVAQKKYWSHLEGFQVLSELQTKAGKGSSSSKSRTSAKKLTTSVTKQKDLKPRDDETPRRSPRLANNQKNIDITKLEERMKSLNLEK